MKGGVYGMLEGLGARVHLFLRPAYRDRFTALFRDTLNCDVRELDFGLQYPVLLVAFGDASGFSVEFSDLASNEAAECDDAQASRGAWIEFRAKDAPKVRQVLKDAGISYFSHRGSAHEYFCAPGGREFRVIDVTYKGP
jgi:hypothetical protein